MLWRMLSNSLDGRWKSIHICIVCGTGRSCSSLDASIILLQYYCLYAFSTNNKELIPFKCIFNIVHTTTAKVRWLCYNALQMPFTRLTIQPHQTRSRNNHTHPHLFGLHQPNMNVMMSSLLTFGASRRLRHGCVIFGWWVCLFRERVGFGWIVWWINGSYYLAIRYKSADTIYYIVAAGVFSFFLLYYNFFTIPHSSVIKTFRLLKRPKIYGFDIYCAISAWQRDKTIFFHMHTVIFIYITHVLHI